MARPDVTLRAIVEDDFDAVRTMQARSFAALGGGANTPEQIKAHVDEIMSPAYRDELHDNHLIVAEDAGGSLVGSAGWCTVPDQPQTARIRKVFVDPEFAGQGMGRLLVEATEADAIAHGFHDFACRANRNAVPFYERLGYRSVFDGVMATSSGVDLPVVFMTKTPVRE